MSTLAQASSFVVEPSAPTFGLGRRYMPLLELAGVVLLFLSLMRFGISELGWFAYAPFLLVLQRDGSRRRHLEVLAVLVLAMVVTVLKIITEEVPFGLAPMYALPLAGALFVSLALSAAAHRRLGLRWGIYLFPSLVVALGWVQYTFTSGASWGAPAHTQADNLPLVQLAALTGIGGISFLVALGSSLTAAALSAGFRAVRYDALGFVVVVLAVLAYGNLRLASPPPQQTLSVGGVVAPTTFKEFPLAMENPDALRSFDDELFSRSARAVELGAKVVVWNEVATFVSPESEAVLTERGRAFAREHEVALLMAYGVLLSKEPFDWINKYRLVMPDGTIADEYLKRQPVPGDGDRTGMAHARVVSFAGAQVTGAICYDYSFPKIARDNARDGAQLVLLPASDWQGIDPLHGQMAIMNAVAVGLPLVRPVRAATSVVSDPYGRIVASMRAGGARRGVMVASVPIGRIPTLYAKTGEVVPMVSLGFGLLCLVGLLRSRGRPS